MGSVNVITARGCLQVPVVLARRLRLHAPGGAAIDCADEVEAHPGRHLAGSGVVPDDVFTIHRSWLLKFAAESNDATSAAV